MARGGTPPARRSGTRRSASPGTIHGVREPPTRRRPPLAPNGRASGCALDGMMAPCRDICSLSRVMSAGSHPPRGSSPATSTSGFRRPGATRSDHARSRRSRTAGGSRTCPATSDRTIWMVDTGGLPRDGGGSLHHAAEFVRPAAAEVAQTRPKPRGRAVRRRRTRRQALDKDLAPPTVGRAHQAYTWSSKRLEQAVSATLRCPEQKWPGAA